MLAPFLQILILAACSFCSLFVGVADISPLDLFSLSGEQSGIFFVGRLPRLCSILVAGSSLAVAGLIMQRIMQNKFVSPTTAGTMQWCKLGVVIAVVCLPGASPILRVGAACAVSLLGTFLFLAIVNKVRGQSAVLVPLIGIMLGSVVDAGATFFAYKFDIIQNIASWLQGNFSLVIAGKYELLYLSVPLMFLAYFYADYFTIAGMGKGTALSLGLNHAAIVNAGLLIVALVSSASVVGVGNIPFVGLIVPNVLAIFKGDGVKNILWDCAWLGALLVLICDIAGRLIIFPYEIPIGVILSVAGAAVFLVLIRSGRRYA